MRTSPIISIGIATTGQKNWKNSSDQSIFKDFLALLLIQQIYLSLKKGQNFLSIEKVNNNFQRNPKLNIIIKLNTIKKIRYIWSKTNKMTMNYIWNKWLSFSLCMLTNQKIFTCSKISYWIYDFNSEFKIRRSHLLWHHHIPIG